MRNTIFAAAAAFALVLSAAPTFAAETPAQAAQTKATDAQAQQQAGKSNDCTNILADKTAHTAEEIANCQPKK